MVTPCRGAFQQGSAPLRRPALNQCCLPGHAASQCLYALPTVRAGAFQPGSEAFAEMVRLRLLLAAAVGAWGLDLVLCDVDTLFMRDPADFFDMCAPVCPRSLIAVNNNNSMLSSACLTLGPCIGDTPAGRPR